MNKNSRLFNHKIHCFLLIYLIIPTATVFFISLTAKRPKGGYSEKASQQNGLVGFISTKAESPFLIYLGFSSFTAPVLLSTLALIS
jgi:hypothetical protein